MRRICRDCNGIFYEQELYSLPLGKYKVEFYLCCDCYTHYFIHQLLNKAFRSDRLQGEVDKEESNAQEVSTES